MRNLSVFALLLLAIGSAPAYASVLQYQFTGTLTGESDENFVPVAQADDLFSAGATLNGTLDYNPNAPATITNQPATGGLSVFGPFSIYAGSIGNLQGAVAGNTFSAASGNSLVANSDSGSATYDGVLNQAGTFDGTVVGTGFAGFKIGDFNLISFDLWSTSTNGVLSSQSLPAAPTNGDLATGVYLIFENSSQQQRIVSFQTDIEPVPVAVPEPSAIWLMGTGMLALGGFRRKR